MIFVYEKDGRKRKATKINCSFCNEEFLKSNKEIRNHKNHFCSRLCANKHKKFDRLKLICSGCQETFEREPSKLRNSKSGLYFCSRFCKDKAQRIGGIKEIQPDHYGKGKHSYRRIAFRNKKCECEVCGYNTHSEILQVHHIDRNRENNNIKNLQILCPNCHAEEHFKCCDGPWKINKGVL